MKSLRFSCLLLALCSRVSCFVATFYPSTCPAPSTTFVQVTPVVAETYVDHTGIIILLGETFTIDGNHIPTTIFATSYSTEPEDNGIGSLPSTSGTEGGLAGGTGIKFTPYTSIDFVILPDGELSTFLMIGYLPYTSESLLYTTLADGEVEILSTSAAVYDPEVVETTLPNGLVETYTTLLLVSATLSAAPQTFTQYITTMVAISTLPNGQVTSGTITETEFQPITTFSTYPTTLSNGVVATLTSEVIITPSTSTSFFTTTLPDGQIQTSESVFAYLPSTTTETTYQTLQDG